MQIVGIRGFSGNRWIVKYKKLAACGCYWISSYVTIVQAFRPADDKIQQAIIENEVNNKR